MVRTTYAFYYIIADLFFEKIYSPQLDIVTEWGRKAPGGDKSYVCKFSKSKYVSKMMKYFPITFANKADAEYFAKLSNISVKLIENKIAARAFHDKIESNSSSFKSKEQGGRRIIADSNQ